MDVIVQQLQAVSATLKGLFKDSGELKGLDDWDKLIGCVATLDSVAFALDSQTDKDEVIDDGR